jgi:hypothetical protein
VSEWSPPWRRATLRQPGKDVVGRVREAASHKQYRDDPILVTMKVLEAAGMLTEVVPE